MAKELYLYSPIFTDVAESLISQLEENMGSDVVLRVNSPGGSVFAGWGIIAKMKEQSSVSIKIDGIAASMAAFMLIFAKSVEVLDTSKIMIHRADMIVANPEEQALLDSINAEMESKLASKIDEVAFKKITGYTISEIFTAEKRIDVWLNAKEAKAIGLVNKINVINPQEITAFNEKFFGIAAISTPVNNQNQNTMNIEKLKAEHPELFASVIALGVAKEKDRVQAWMAYVDIDAKTVSEGIEAGHAPSLKEQAELNRKAMSADAIKALEKGSAAATTTTEVVATEATELEKFEAQIDKNLGLTKK